MWRARSTLDSASYFISHFPFPIFSSRCAMTSNQLDIQIIAAVTAAACALPGVFLCCGGWR